MADEQPKEQKKGLPLKTALLVAVLLFLEAGAIVGAMVFLGGPSEVQGVPLDGLETDDPAASQVVEIPLLHERFTNNARGTSMVYDTEILLMVPVQHRARVEATLEEKRGQIRTGISRIWRSADQAHFNEPGYETLSRQTRDFILSLLGAPPEGGPLIQRVLIPKCMGFRNDF